MKATGTSLSQRDILALVGEDLEKVEKDLASLTSSAHPLIDSINKYLHDSGGKRLRPAVLLLCSKLCGFEGEAAVKLGAVVELIHVATLVHDDIIDNANIRRGRASVNATWGNQITVLMGDWIYMTAFALALERQKFRVLEILIDVTRTMVEGELIQLEKNWRTDISAEEQLDISFRKTACLFAGCGRLSAVISGSGPEKEERLARYGLSLGMAFQVTDDLLDYTSNPRTLGKPVLKDLEEGKITLPIISLLGKANQEEREFVRSVVQNRDFNPENKKRLIGLVQRYEALKEAQELARHHADHAVQSVSDFPPSIYREALMKIPDFVVSRES